MDQKVSPRPDSAIAAALTSVTCHTCEHTVRHVNASKRTICPKCGTFYNRKSGPPSAKDRVIAFRQMETKSARKSARSTPLTRDLSILHASSSNSAYLGNDCTSTTLSPLGDKTSKLKAVATNEHLPPLSNSISPSPRAAFDNFKSDSPSHSHSNNIFLNERRSWPAPDIEDNHWSIVKSVESTEDLVKYMTCDKLLSLMRNLNDSKSYNTVHTYYSTIFESFTWINRAFKIMDATKDTPTVDDVQCNLELVHIVFDSLIKLPSEIHKLVLKSMINCLLKDERPHSKDDLRGYLVLIQNPLFKKSATYVIFAHLLRQIAGLTDQDHHFLVYWFKRLKPSIFKAVVERIQNFISCRLFPPKPEDLPPMNKCSWWIPSATKVLALFNASNNFSMPSLMPFQDFYNESLDNLDLMVEYYTWQNPSTHPGFSFCQYPFIISIAAKQTILQRDSEQQMIIMARRSLVAKVQRRQLPDIGMLFLNLNVRRSHLVSDSLNEIARKQHDLKKKLKVNFIGEPGLDMGGLTKEWFLLLVRQIFQEEYAMFTYDQKSRSYWFKSGHFDSYQEFRLVGVLMGLAVYNCINLDIRFPPVCYRKLLNPAVVPYNKPATLVGVCPVSLTDLEQTKPDLARGLKILLDYDGDIEEGFGVTFQISYEEWGHVCTHALKEGGSEIAVTKDNVKEYVQLYIDHILNKSVYQQFQAFYHGFHCVCASNALIMLRPEEVEMLVCGCPNLDISALRAVTVYDGYTANDATIRRFWELVEAMSTEIQKRLLLFITGSDRIPVGGMSELQLKITKVNDVKMLPIAHTCFNQLVLPNYETRKILKQKLLIAIQNAEGFGLE